MEMLSLHQQELHYARNQMIQVSAHCLKKAGDIGDELTLRQSSLSALRGRTALCLVPKIGFEHLENIFSSILRDTLDDFDQRVSW